MQSSMLGESNRRMKIEIFRKLDNAEVLMHTKDAQRYPYGDGYSGSRRLVSSRICLRDKPQDRHLDDLKMIEEFRGKIMHERYRPENRRQMDVQNEKEINWQWHLW